MRPYEALKWIIRPTAAVSYRPAKHRCSQQSLSHATGTIEIDFIEAPESLAELQYDIFFFGFSTLVQDLWWAAT